MILLRYMKKIFSLVLSLILGATVATAVLPTNTYAADANEADCAKLFLGLRPWYMGLTTVKKDSTERGVCVIMSPEEFTSAKLSTSNTGASYFWTIVLNISADVTLVAGYVALIFTIYGGFKYILSTGEPGKVALAKTIITNSLIGLAIAVLATVIVNTVILVLGIGAN